MNEEFLWTEKYRPHKIEECILPDRIKSIFQQYVDDNSIPNLMLTGSAGVGKTTVARALCEELGINHLFINSSEERGIDTLRTKITGYASTISLTGGRKVIILDEADYLTPEAQAGLRGAIEKFSQNCTFIFTCNYKSRLMDALHSRCSVIDFNIQPEEKPKMAFSFFRRMEYVLQNENVTYDKKALVKLVEKFFPDYRRTVNELQRYATSGNIDAGVIVQISDVRKMDELAAFLKEKNFNDMRKWVVDNLDVEPARVYRKIYDAAYKFFKPESVPQAIIIISRYQYQSAFVADQEINTTAMLTELMVDCEFN